MQIVSPSCQLRSRLAWSLHSLFGIVGIVASLGLSAAGTFPALSQSGSVVSSGRQVEPAGLERRTASDERLSLKRALADGRPPSGSEERKQLSLEERRALLQDLRNVTRDLSEGGYSSPRPDN
jgi:hypothetical protein